MTNLQDRNALWKGFRPFFIGGFSACCATVCVQPIDMVKVQIQLQEGGAAGGTVIRNPVTMAGHLVKNNGPMFLYKGLSAGLLRQMTYGLTRLGIFRTLTNKFAPEGGTAADISFMTKLGCSLTAGGIGAVVGTPADAALVRMQADTKLPVEQRRGYKNGLDALFRMAREEGLRGFFTGATPTVCRGLAINVGMLMTYDSFKKLNASWTGGETSQTNRFVSGFLSGWVAATVSLPFDFIKTRLQKQAPDANGVLPYKNVPDCFRKVAAQEGMGALYQGYGTFVVRITPHIMLTWVFMDNVKDFLASRNM